MDSFSAAVEVIIDPSRSQAGERQTIASLDRIIRHGQRVGAANDNMAGSFGRAGQGMAGAAREGGALSRVLDDVRGRAAGATPAVGGLVQSLMGMGPLAAIAGGVALAVGAIGAAGIKAAAQTQSWLAQLETVTGSAEKAKESYGALVKFGNSTPFDTGQSVAAFVKLRQMGLAATEERLRSFGNTASASGKSLNQMIEAVADAGTGEFERLKEFGIKTKTEGNNVKFTMAGVTTQVANNSVAITEYLTKIGNTKFAGAMDREMKTLNGAFAGVQDSIRGMLSSIGEGQLGKSVGAIANAVAQGITAITPLMSSIGNAVGGIVGGVGSAINGLGNLWSAFHGGSNAVSMLDALTVGFNLVGQGVQVMGNVVGAVMGGVANLASGVADAWRSSFGSMLGDLTNGFDNGGRSWSNSIVGVLRTTKVVAGLLPQIFRVAVSDIMKMFRDMGNGIAAFMRGDFKGGAALFGKQQFVSTGKAATAVGRIGNATYNDTKGADAAIGRLLGRTGKSKLDIGLDSKPDKPGDKKKGGKTDAEKLAEKIDDFWKKLNGDSKDAEATYASLAKAAAEGRNLSVASADTAKQLEFQRLAGRDITADEKTRIANALQTGRTAKFLTDSLVAGEQRKYDMQLEQLVLDKRRAGMTESQLDVERGVAKFRVDAMKTGLDLNSAAYKAAEDKLRIDLQSGEAIQAQNKALDDQKAKYKALVEAGKGVIEKYSPQATLTGQLDGFKTERQQADAYYAENKGKPGVERAYQDAIKNIGRAATEATTRFETRWVDAIDQIAYHFTGKLGTAINGIAQALQNLRSQGTGSDSSLFGGLANLLGSKVGEAYKDQGAANAKSLTGALANPLGSLKDGFKDFKGLFTNTGSGGFASILGKGLAKAGMGMEMGSMADGLLKGIGIKSSKTGAQIGGGIGGLVGGPIGGAIGGALGGIVGGLFKKDKQASSGFSVIDGKATVTAGKGYGKAAKAEAAALASSVAEGLNGIVSQLGGQLGDLSGVSVGYRPGHKAGAYRVDTTGRGKLTGVVAFETQAEAIAFAIKDAIKDGAITGLSDLINKAVKGMDIDAAIGFASDWKKLTDDLTAMGDPMTAAIQAIIQPLDAMRGTMTKLGASSTDLATLEDYRSKKLNAAYKEQISGFQDLLSQLNGSAGGVSDYNQLNTKLGEFDKFRSDIAAGKQVDQSAFTTLAGEILNLNSNVNGTGTSAYQNIISMLRENTSGAIGTYKATQRQLR